MSDPTADMSISIDELLTHTTWVRQLAFSLTRDPNEADELIQETWLRVIRRPPRIGMPVRTWLARVIHNAAHSRHRSTRRRAAREQSGRGSRKTVPSVTETLERADLHALLVHAMQQLPAPDRALVAMRYLEDQPPRALAAQLGLPVETVRKRLQRARAQLRERLESHYGSDWRASCLAFATLSTSSQGLLAMLGGSGPQKLSTAALALLTGGLSWFAFEHLSGRDPVADPVSPRAALARPGAKEVFRDVDRTRPARGEPTTGDGTRPRTPAPAAERGAVTGVRPGTTPEQPPRPAGNSIGTLPTDPSSPQSSPPAIQPVDPTLLRLNKLAKRWFADRHALDAATDERKRARLAERARRSRHAFMTTWNLVTPGRDLLRDTAALRAVFLDVFPYERPRYGLDKARLVQAKDAEYALFVPRSYDSDTRYATVLKLPSRMRSSPWANPQNLLEVDWRRTALGRSALALAIKISEAAGIDAPFDPADADQFPAERARVRLVLGPAGDFQREFRVDRNRLILDCGRGTTLFGLRLASYFPARFAGVVLRWPELDGSVSLDNLRHLPILLVEEPRLTRDIRWLKTEIERVGGSCTVVRGRTAGAIDEWITVRRRGLAPTSVVFAPTIDVARSAYWVSLGRTDDRPSIRAVANRQTSTLTVETHGVHDFSLLLDDSLVDLSSFRVIVNGVQRDASVEPSIETLTELIYKKYDASYLFPAVYHVDVRGK